MKPISELDLGFRDSENYRRKENREIFNQIFVRTPELDKLCDPSTFFLIGEKGTGKTAYAVYLSNVEYNNNVAALRYLRETEYLKFVALKKAKQLDLSDYMSVWKVIIYLLLAEQIRSKQKAITFKGFPLFDKLGAAIDEFYQHAFSPEIINAIQFAEEASRSAKLIYQFAEAGANGKSSVNFTESTFQVNLLYIQKQFEDAFKSLKLGQNHILFIDGVDIRPQSVDYDTYLESIKGLANAVWAVNNDFFSNIKDSKGRIRVILLVRPDIFNTLGLQNQNSKVRDNSVVLNWITTYADYRRSPLFMMADRLLAYQQEGVFPPGAVWDYYFPYDATNLKIKLPSPTSFIQFIRYSLYRPRNTLTLMSIQKEIFVENGKRTKAVFSYEDFANPLFIRKYSDYILGEVRDHISFYYDSKDYESLLKFFQFLNGKSYFNYEEFINAFLRYIKFLKKNSFDVPAFCETPDVLLQFLYDLNILGYIAETSDKKHPFYSWCNRERSPSNIAPKVRTHVKYEIHYGLMKALDLGMLFKIDEDTDWDNSILE